MTIFLSENEQHDWHVKHYHLLNLEEFLYDLEVNGEDVWFERDKIINELNRDHTE